MGSEIYTAHVALLNHQLAATTFWLQPPTARVSGPGDDVVADAGDFGCLTPQDSCMGWSAYEAGARAGWKGRNTVLTGTVYIYIL